MSFTANSNTAESGHVTVTVQSGPAGGGTYQNQVDITITVTPPADTTAPNAPTIDLDGDSDSGGPAPTTSRTTSLRPSMVLPRPAARSGSTTAPRAGHHAATGGGAWSFTTAALGDGGHSFTATARDAAGNTSTASSALAVTIDTAAPSAPVDQPHGRLGPGHLEHGRPHVRHHPDARRRRRSRQHGRGLRGGHLARHHHGDLGRLWSLTTAALSDGGHSLTARATDIAGNISPASSALVVTIDATPPAQPTINLVDGSDSGASNTDDITTDNTPTLDGEAETGSTVQVLEGTTVLETVTAGAGNRWTATTGVLTDGVHVLTARSTDAAGNVSTASITLIVTADTAPDAPPINLDAAATPAARTTTTSPPIRRPRWTARPRPAAPWRSTTAALAGHHDRHRRSVDLHHRRPVRRPALVHRPGDRHRRQRLRGVADALVVTTDTERRPRRPSTWPRPATAAPSTPTTSPRSRR